VVLFYGKAMVFLSVGGLLPCEICGRSGVFGSVQRGVGAARSCDSCDSATPQSVCVCRGRAVER
jgi:hypothetical protein